MIDIAFRFPEFYENANCDFIVRAPGRVNLIGEHTDYNGFPVLPMSLDRAVYAGVKRREDKTIRIKNTDTRFTERIFEIEKDIPSYEGGDWGNYAKAGVQGVLDWEETNKPVQELSGMDVLISSNVPSGVGLSSSSAMVVMAALAFLESNRIAYNRVQLAEMLAFAEHYVGTQGGGMDQAICLLGEQGKALKIDFFPLKAKPVPIPDGWSVVICNSLIQAEKTRAALRLYNRRPIECRIATEMLSKEMSKPEAKTACGFVTPRYRRVCGTGSIVFPWGWLYLGGDCRIFGRRS